MSNWKLAEHPTFLKVLASCRPGIPRGKFTSIEPRAQSIAALVFAALFCLVAATARADSAQASVETDGGLEVKSADGDFSFELGGEIWVDMARYDEDDALGDDATEFDDGTEVRRARLSLEGIVHDDWGYALEYDFSSSEAKDMYLEYVGFKGVDIRIGNFKEPFSMENMTSGKATIFMERSLPVDTFSPGRNLGVAAFAGGKRWSLSAGAFGEAHDSDTEGDDGRGSSIRASFAPIAAKRSTLHIGASGFQRSPPEEEDELRFRDELESRIADQELIDTGDISDVDEFYGAGLELAIAYGPFLLQGEQIDVKIERDRNAGADLEFSGWYLSAGWVVTGEKRSYNGARGRFNRVEPKGRGTAWEIAIRASNLDLSDEEIEGGELKNTTLAVNAYVNDNVRFRINMIRAEATPNEDGDDEEVDILQARAEIYF